MENNTTTYHIPNTTKSHWYKDAVFYQINPRTFCDSNGDGIGDIQGIISKIPYLKNLGINAVWLSPIYGSPNNDNGYDIADYFSIHPDFGTMDDAQQMIAEFKKNNIRLILDLVVNHTSHQHSWFIESQKSKDNEYRDYYIWRKGKGKNGKKPPNNWTSRFTGSAWTYDKNTDEWYLHLYTKEQPDLNWDNPKVRQGVAEISQFWLDKGIDGFRCDVITYIGKQDGLPDGKNNLFMRGDEHFSLHDKCHTYLQELNQKVFSHYDTFIIGEIIGVNADRAQSILAEDRQELDSGITFEHMSVDTTGGLFPVKLNLPRLKSVLSKWQNLPTNCWQTLYYENHDQPRSVSRFCKPKNLQQTKLAAQMLAVSLHFQRGTPFVYQGQELGMTNISLKPNQYQDIMAKQVLALGRSTLLLYPIALYALQHRSRDNARTPVQWDDTPNAGFTSGTTNLNLNPNYLQINAKQQQQDARSVFNFYKTVISLRRGNPLIQQGSYKELCNSNKRLYIYERQLDNQKYLVICNFTAKNCAIPIDIASNQSQSSLVLSNYDDAPQTFYSSAIRPFEARVYLFTQQTIQQT